jgi:hypothetical protein
VIWFLVLENSRASHELCRFVRKQFQVLFHRVSHPAFHLSLTVLVHYRSLALFSLGGWFPQIPTRYVPRSTWEFPRVTFDLAYEIFTLFDWTFQTILLSNINPTLGSHNPSCFAGEIPISKFQSPNKLLFPKINILNF